jgi:DNA-binding TFAR19-related protein (PDSD5 family)
MVDYSIAAQVRPFQMPNIGEIYGQAQNIQMNRMRMAEAQETAQERNALRGLLSSGVDPYSAEGLSQVRRVAPMLAAPFEQAASQRAYQTAQAGRLRAQTQADQIKTARDLLSGVSNQAQWDAWRRSTVAALPEYADAIPTQFSPQNVQRVAEGAEGLIRRASEATAAARPTEFDRVLRAANILPGTPEYETAMRGRAEYLRGVRPTPSEFVMIEGAPFARVREGNTFRLIPVLQGDEPATTGAAPAAPPARPPANAFVAPPAAAAPAPTAAAPVATQPMLPRTPAEARAQALAQEEAKAGARETGQLRARSRDQATNDLTVMTEALAIIDSITARREDMPEGNSLLQTATGSFAGAGRDLAFRAAGWETASNNAALALEAQQAALVSLLPRMRGDLNRAEFDSLMAQAGKIGDRTQTYQSRLLALNTVRDRLSRIQQRLATQAGVELPPTPAPATPPPAAGARGATDGGSPRTRPDGRTARVPGQQGSASTTAAPGAEAPPVPPGVEATPEEWGLLWSVMPERERALWRRN